MPRVNNSQTNNMLLSCRSLHQVLAAAAERMQREAAERAAAEAACLKHQAARLSVLNLQAQECLQRSSAQKQRLAVSGGDSGAAVIVC